jgi:hypothetical protein
MAAVVGCARRFSGNGRADCAATMIGARTSTPSRSAGRIDITGFLGRMKSGER